MSLAERWLKTIPALKELDIRVGLLTKDLADGEAPALALALEEVAELAEQADPRAREVLAALVPALASSSFDDLQQELRQEALDNHLLALGRLLRKRAHQFVHDAPEPGQRHLGESAVGRALTLGERKSMARRPDRFMLDRLLRDPHPAVIKNLLGNPRITEDDVMRLASRRPNFPDILTEIARSPKWSHRTRVRLCLVQNPFTPPDLAVALVQLLIRPELEQVLAATEIAAVVRAAARELLERRPPIPLEEEDVDPDRLQ